MTLEKFFNLVFYATWLVAKSIRRNFIERPIQKLAVYFYPRSKAEELKKYKRYILSQEKKTITRKQVYPLRWFING